MMYLITNALPFWGAYMAGVAIVALVGMWGRDRHQHIDGAAVMVVATLWPLLFFLVLAFNAHNVFGALCKTWKRVRHG